MLGALICRLFDHDFSLDHYDGDDHVLKCHRCGLTFHQKQPESVVVWRPPDEYWRGLVTSRKPNRKIGQQNIVVDDKEQYYSVLQIFPDVNEVLVMPLGGVDSVRRTIDGLDYVCNSFETLQKSLVGFGRVPEIAWDH